MSTTTPAVTGTSKSTTPKKPKSRKSKAKAEAKRNADGKFAPKSSSGAKPKSKSKSKAKPKPKSKPVTASSTALTIDQRCERMKGNYGIAPYAAMEIIRIAGALSQFQVFFSEANVEANAHFGVAEDGQLQAKSLDVHWVVKRG